MCGVRPCHGTRHTQRSYQRHLPLQLEQPRHRVIRPTFRTPCRRTSAVVGLGELQLLHLLLLQSCMCCSSSSACCSRRSSLRREPCSLITLPPTPTTPWHPTSPISHIKKRFNFQTATVNSLRILKGSAHEQPPKSLKVRHWRTKGDPQTATESIMALSIQGDEEENGTYHCL